MLNRCAMLLAHHLLLLLLLLPMLLLIDSKRKDDSCMLLLQQVSVFQKRLVAAEEESSLLQDRLSEVHRSEAELEAHLHSLGEELRASRKKDGQPVQQSASGGVSEAAAALQQLLGTGSMEARFGPGPMSVERERLRKELDRVSDLLSKEAAMQPETLVRLERWIRGGLGQHGLSLSGGVLSPDTLLAATRGLLLEALDECVWKRSAQAIGRRSTERSQPPADGLQGVALWPLGSPLAAAVCEAASLVAASDRCRQLLACLQDLDAEHASASKTGVQERLSRATQQMASQLAMVFRTTSLYQTEQPRRLLVRLVRHAFSLWVYVTAAHPLLEIVVSRPGFTLSEPQSSATPSAGQQRHEVVKAVQASRLPPGSFSPSSFVLASQSPGICFSRVTESGPDVTVQPLLPELVAALVLEGQEEQQAATSEAVGVITEPQAHMDHGRLTSAGPSSPLPPHHQRGWEQRS